ncbi:GldG family protein [Acidihalobacter prosperus]|uniref:Uncharacterized protein n=1 Tax=Acidihalobacter prosperus TaxID=160660 RepID=A0A1A6C558_9GAMM|nr:GldG family protein [Acidihalobacter prosperus]OBS09680.1 hypothetical protein Thpro_022008 [Acidihalobacter prosperus]
MQISRTTRWHLRLNSLIFVALFLVAVGLLAWLSHRYDFDQDWTYTHRNSLAPVTRKLIAGIRKPIHFIAFVSDDAALHARIRRQLAQYRRAGHDVTLSFVNPDLAPKRAQQYGVRHTGQLVIEIDGRSRVIDSLGQQSIANALMQLARSGNRWVVFIEGQKERSPLDDSSRGLSRLATSLAQTGLHVQPINLLRTPHIPENTAVLVVAGPETDFTPGEATAITQYVEKGGDLLWLHDPGSLHGLAALARTLDLRFVPGTVVDANPELRAMIGIQNPAVVPVLDYGQSPITEHLQVQTLMPFTAAIAQPAGGKDWQAEPLLRSLPKSWSETGPLQGDVKFDAARGDTLGPLVLGEAFSRKRTDGHQQRIAVFGTSAFVSNAFIGRGANLNLATATLNWLSHDDSLVQIHLPSAPDTRLVLSRGEGYAIAAGFLILFPIGLLVSGTLVWMRRRRAAR